MPWLPTVTAASEASVRRNVTTRLGDELSLDFEYIGPTRERCTASLIVPVAMSERSLSLSATASAELPHHAFALNVVLKQHDSLGGQPIPGVPIEVMILRSIRMTTPMTTTQARQQTMSQSRAVL